METVLLDKIKRLSEHKQQEVQVISYLMLNYSRPYKTTSEKIAGKRIRNLGTMNGKTWAIQGFNDTPGYFKVYM